MVTLEQKDRNSGYKAASHRSVRIRIPPVSSGSGRVPVVGSILRWRGHLVQVPGCPGDGAPLLPASHGVFMGLMPTSVPLSSLSGIPGGRVGSSFPGLEVMSFQAPGGRICGENATPSGGSLVLGEVGRWELLGFCGVSESFLSVFQKPPLAVAHGKPQGFSTY